LAVDHHFLAAVQAFDQKLAEEIPFAGMVAVILIEFSKRLDFLYHCWKELNNLWK
jgi:hypothetical protein